MPRVVRDFAGSLGGEQDAIVPATNTRADWVDLQPKSVRVTFPLLAFPPDESKRAIPVRGLRRLVRPAPRRRFVLAAICASLVALSCAADEPATQLVVLMDTDYAVPIDVDRIRARVSKVMETDSSPLEVETWRKSFSVSNDGAGGPGIHPLPATFGVLPGQPDLDREIVIELEALATGTEQALVSRRVKTWFMPGEARLARMALFRACAGVVCSPGHTCGCPGAAPCAVPSCVDETVPPEDLEPISNPGVLPTDAGIPIGDGDQLDGGGPSDDGGTQVDGGVPDGGTPDGGGTNCAPPLLICGMDCVNPQADPRYCGDCATSCPVGQVCEMGSCLDPGDCRSNGIGCSGFSYCDETSGECLPGCTEPQQCTGQNETCDVASHDCVCAPGFERCEGGCVDTQIDPNFCGDCTRSCPIGQFCEGGLCDDPGDCRTNGAGCAGFTYCDETTGDCLRGCADNEQCTGGGEICDTITHECVCSAGLHRCGAVCVSDLDVSSCGTACTPCPVPPNSTPICDTGTCDFLCDDTYERCDQMCCPTACLPGEILYNRACAKTHLQTADEAGSIGEYSSLALDASGKAHIVYYARSGRDLAHAVQQANDSWTSERADTLGEVGQYASAAIDLSGVLHVAYYDPPQKDLKYATRESGGAWEVEVVQSGGDVGEHASLVVDDFGNPHIGYYDGANKALMYATRQSGGAWAIKVVDDDGDVGQYASIALDPAGTPHISYHDETDEDLMRASREPDGTWRAQVVASNQNVGKYTSLAIDANRAARISYYRENTKDLLYAVESAEGLWTSVTVDNLGDVGTHTSLVLDASGAARVSYYDESAGDLKYAVQLPGGSWSIETVDSQGDVGRYTSIAVDALNQTHISYYDVTNTNLKYALIAAAD